MTVISKSSIVAGESEFIRMIVFVLMKRKNTNWPSAVAVRTNGNGTPQKKPIKR